MGRLVDLDLWSLKPLSITSSADRTMLSVPESIPVDAGKRALVAKEDDGRELSRHGRCEV